MAIENLPRFAETYFNSECARYGATCHSSSEDETGWDFLIEIDDKSVPRHEAKELISSYIQVKSAIKGKTRCKVKLSNALNSCRSPNPWFIFFISEDGDHQEFYIKHFDKSLIERSLKRVWQSSIESKQLNKEFLYISFTDEDKVKDDIISFIKNATKEGIRNYRERKNELFETLGREEHYGTGTVTIKAENLNSFYKEVLGIGTGISGVDFQFYNERFGVAEVNPHVDLKNGILKIDPSPAGKFKIRIVRKSSQEYIEMEGLFYLLNTGETSKEEIIVRFSTEFMEIIHPPIDDSGIKINFSFTDKYRLSVLDSFCRLMSWSDEKDLNSEIWISSSIIFRGEVNINPGYLGYDWSKISTVVQFLDNAFNTTDNYVSLEMEKITSNYNYIESARILAKADLIKYYMDDIIGEWHSVKYSIYFICVNIGDYDINLLVERDCLVELKDATDPMGENAKFCATMSNPRILDFSITESDDQAYTSMKDRYNRYVKTYDQDHILELEDAMKILE